MKTITDADRIANMLPLDGSLDHLLTEELDFLPAGRAPSIPCSSLPLSALVATAMVGAGELTAQEGEALKETLKGE